MRLPSIPPSWLAKALSGLVPPEGELPLWPPIHATRGAGSRTAPHSHHAMHLLVGLGGELRVRTGPTARWSKAPGVLTRPDVLHAIDAQGVETLLIFFDPESDAGEALHSVLREPVRLLSSGERDRLAREARPDAIMGADGVEWTRQAVATLGRTITASPRFVHPRVRKLLRILRAMPLDADRSLGKATTRPSSGGSTARGSGASFSSARCVREPW